ncbi:hypothetical protein [Candidatus Lokiarchaeum ossiferum]|uniref:hypothetical protein n=1 Tax=Candidatus Lokiarchaeum ossiferum TaxID=2951803 RepID=UPI00352EB926
MQINVKRKDKVTSFWGFNPEGQVISEGYVIFHNETPWMVQNQKFIPWENEM